MEYDSDSNWFSVEMFAGHKTAVGGGGVVRFSPPPKGWIFYSVRVRCLKQTHLCELLQPPLFNTREGNGEVISQLIKTGRVLIKTTFQQRTDETETEAVEGCSADV